MISSSLKSASKRQHIEQDPMPHQELQTHPRFHLPWKKLQWGGRRGDVILISMTQRGHSSIKSK